MSLAAPLSAGRRIVAWSVVGGLLVAALCTDRAGADERKFMVMLALSSKSADSGDEDYPAASGEPPLNFSEVRKAYFDPENDEDILSFREYWEEISYGDVTVSGDAFDFVNLPWRQYPLGAALPGDQDADLKLVWVDLDNDPTVRQFQYGVGEVFTELEQMYQRTKLGRDELGSWGASAAEGLKDGVWTPGERFRDVNGSGNYTYVECPDALDHNFSCTESELAIDADGNGQFDCPVCGLDVAGVFPEPFEDFLRVYDPTRPEGERWVILYYDEFELPSWYNPGLYPKAETHGAFGRDFQRQLADYTAVDYVGQNYPGNVVKLVGTVGQPYPPGDEAGRIANGEYDGPDKWIERNESDNATIKLRDTGFSEPGFSTPAPGWLGTFWSARYGTATPGWRSDIPRLEYFNPATPDPSPDGDGQRAFLAAQEGVPTIAGGVYPPDDASQGTSSVLPDQDQVYYDGPVEFDDMASSIYHTSSSGDRWTNGDLRLGEATSPASFNNFGDTVDGRPGNIPSAGPMASRLFGERGRPAGNQLNLELLTWRSLPDGGASSTRPQPQLDPGKAIWNSSDPVTTQTPNPVTYAEMYAGGFRDFNLDGLVDQGETLPFDTEEDQYSNYAISVFESPFMVGQYPFNRTRLVEDVVEALDPTVDFNQFTAQGGPYAGHIYGTVLVTPQDEEPFNAVGRERAPSLVPIQTEDGTFFFANLVGSLANVDAEDTLQDPPIKPDYNLSVTTHEYGHTWEGWPDLYDETEFDQGDVVINNPVGRWDLMALNAVVHPAPYLKENVNIGTGHFNFRALRQHTPWISPLDLRTVLTPGQEQTIIIPPCEFTRPGAFYYFDNIATPARRERFYFWVVSNQGFSRSIDPNDNPDVRIPHAGLPGFGLLIAHVDLGGEATWEWDGSTWTNVSPPPTSPSPSPRLWHAMAYDAARGRVVLFGGNDGRLNAETWEWDGSKWIERFPPTSPSPRYDHAMAYDNARGRVVLFGGNDGNLDGETWEWDGSAWSLVATTGPSPRDKHAMAYDGARVVLFGGNDGNLDGETWEWDGSAWSLVATTGPSPRYDHAMAYDAARGRVVLFGGNDGSFDGETWEWDGSAWSLVATTGPSPRFGHAMAYDDDAARRRVVLFGGNDGRADGETWDWNGSAWRRRSTGGPSRQDGHAMAYDVARGQVVLFGGGDPFPAQNTDSTGSFWTYNLLQADGLEELESNFELDGIGPGDCTRDEDDIGEQNSGDAGDPFPGCANTREWNADTLPSSMWHDQLESGLEILDVQSAPPAGKGRAVTFLWDPREVPSLSFVRPPGGESVPCGPPVCTGDCEIYRIQYRAFDFFGGTEIEFYRDDDNAGYDGVLLAFDLTSDLPADCSAGASTTRVPKQPGSIENNVPIDVSSLGDGEYFFYARLVPSGSDPSVSDVYPSSANVGTGTLQVDNVDLSKSRVEVWTVFALAGGSPGAEEWQVTGSASGNQQNTAITGVAYTTDDGSVSFTIDSGAVAFAPGDRFTFFTTGFTPYSISLKIQDGTVLAQPKAIFQPTPATGGAPLTVTFVSTSLEPEDQPLTHLWDFGDGGSQSGVDLRVVQHEYTDPGDYVVTLTVTNPQGEEDSASEVVRVIANQAPVAVVTANPTSGEAPITVEFDGTQSFDPEGTNLTGEWNFGDGSNVVTGSMDPNDVGKVSHLYQQMGTWTATLTVTDQGGASNSATVTIELTGNTAPAAAFTADPTTGGAPLKVTFDASASSDVDGDPLSFAWDFGDGSDPGDGVIVEHTYLAIGSYTVTLTVSDGEAEGVATRLVQVVNEPPLIALTVTYNKQDRSPPLEVTFDASASSDPEGGALSFSWLFGDGTTHSGDPVVTHTYERVGVFTARLTVADPEGASSTESRSITVRVPGNREPVVSLVPDKVSGDAPLTVNVDLSATSDPDGDPVMLTVDFGDGNVLVNLLPSSAVGHTYTQPGTYTIVAVGTDSAGAAAKAEVVITVTGVPPTEAPAPGAAAFPCALGIVQMMAGTLVGLVLMAAGASRRRRR